MAYYLQGAQASVYFGTASVTMSLLADAAPDKAARAADRPSPPAVTRSNIRIDFEDANHVRPVAGQTTPATVGLFKGPPDQWRTGLRTFREVTYSELWPGIDLVYSGTGSKLKYTFTVHPGADPSRIRMVYRGAGSVELATDGQLEISTATMTFREDRPVSYQEADPRRVEVASHYRVQGDGDRSIVSFSLGAYDPARPLVIDPTVLVYAGYIGGTSADRGDGIAVDSAGNAYVIGHTSSEPASFPETVGPDITFNSGVFDAFIAKVNASGTGLVYAGYIGGSGDDRARAVAVDASGNAYVAGTTDSTEATFPVTVGPDLTQNGHRDGFVTKVNAAGTGLVYSGYIGGAFDDFANAIALSGSGEAFVVGSAGSSQTSFPVVGGPDLTYNGDFDAYVTKINASGTAVVYSGYIGGAQRDTGTGVAVDGAGNAYVSGFTVSTEADGFPLVVGPDLTHGGTGQAAVLEDGFVAKVNPAGTALIYSGYIGGSGYDYVFDIAVDAAGYAYIVGDTTNSPGFPPPTVGPDLTSNGALDVFVGKLNPSATSFVYLGFIGGSDDDSSSEIAIDTLGNAYVVGTTRSSETEGFPVLDGPDLTFNPGGLVPADPFVAKVNPAGTALVYAGYIGGTDTIDEGVGIAVDAAGNAYVTGYTNSSETEGFPVLAGPDLTFNGGQTDAFVAKISSPEPGTFTPLTPARILDTRNGTGGISSAVGPGVTVDVQGSGRGGVPATGVSAVAVNVTVTQPSGTGFLTLFPTGTSRPEAANLNFTPGKTVPNLVVVKLGAGGKVGLYNSSGSSHVIFDVAGWYSTTPSGNAGRYSALVPARILDTRGGVRLAPGASRELQVSGQGGVPGSGVAAAVLNVAVTGPTATSFLTVFPTGAPRPDAANLNFTSGNTVSNRVMAKLGTGGRVTIYNNAGSTDVIVDVGGWYSDASLAGLTGAYTALAPARIVDTRNGTGAITGPIAGNTSVEVQITGRGGVPFTGVSAVILNATVTEPAAAGYLTISPAGSARPLASDLNYAPSETRPNLVVVRVGTGGKVSLFTSAGTHVIFDVAGWFS